MKVPLNYQVTLYDCGPMSLINSLMYVLDSDKIPAVILKKIFKYTLDIKDDKGNIGNGGTSFKALIKFSKWLNKYAKKNKLNLKLVMLKKDNITLDRLKECLDKNGCVLVKCYQSVLHYVIITKIDKKYIYLFDPYYVNKKVKDKELKIIKNKAFNYNRRITINRLFSSTQKDFAMGNLNNRECILIYRND